MLAKFSGFNPKGPHLSLEKEKVTFCVVFTYSAKRAREIRKFHVDKKCRSRYCRRRASLLNLGPIAAIQKFGYYGNLMSHFSFLFNLLNKDTPFATVFLCPLSVESVRINGV